MHIFLVRHGEAAASWGESPDPGLSETGWQQAEQAAVLLEAAVEPGSLLLSSPLQRAKQTAEPTARRMRQSVQIDTDFREIPAPVPLENRQAWLRQFMQEQWHEQGAELLHWRAAIVERLLALQQPAVIFTHFLVINAVVGHALGRSDTLCFWPANGSITRIRQRGDGLELLELGQEMQTFVN